MRKIKFPWQPLRWLFYDCEIQKCIPSDDDDENSGYEYCGGWHDHTHMGISCIAAYTSWDKAYRVFDDESLDEFKGLINKTDRILGFNSKSFDDKLCAANNIRLATDYDLLEEVRIAAGMPPTYVKGITRAGYSLDSLSKFNFNAGKTSSGEFAPKLFQDGKYEALQAYCLNDVFLSVQLLNIGWDGMLFDPTNELNLQLRPLR